MSSSNSTSRNAAQRERERRAAARAKRQAAKAAAAPASAEGATGDSREQHREQPRERVAVPARKETKGATLVADAEATALPMADPHGRIAILMMLAVVVLLGLLAIAVMAAT